jgi:hypothetical protein
MPDDTSQTTQVGADKGTQTGVSLGTQTDGTQTQQTTTQTGSDGKSTTTSDPWYKAHVKDADNLKAIETAKWADVDAIIKSNREAQKLISQKGAAHHAPSDPKEYTFNVPEAMKGAYNQQFADGFRQWAHKAGLSKEQAAAVHDEFVKYAGTQLSTQQQSATEAIGSTVTKAKAALEKAWGADVTPAFTRSLEMAKRAISQLDPDLAQELRDVGAVVKVGNEEMIAKPALFKALAKVGGQLYAEDTLYGAAANANNPFDEKTMDMTMQGHLIKTDPAKAKLLIRAAGPKAIELYQHFLAQG